MNTPLVSIIINNYNYASFIRSSINSALSQTYPNIEVIVVDDGSTDNSLEIISEYGCKIKTVLKENHGQASSLNEGFLASKGDIIFFLDADDFFEKDKVDRIVDIFKNQPDVSWVFHTLKLVDIETMEALALTGQSYSSKCDFRQQLRSGFLDFAPSPTSGICIRRSLLEKILPMQVTFLKTSADRYVRLAALAMSPGYFLDEALASQVIHGNNAATRIKFKPLLNENGIVIAYLLKTRFPEISVFTDRFLARGISAYWKKKGPKNNYRNYIDKYFEDSSLIEKSKILFIALYQSRPWRKGHSHRHLSSVQKA